MSKRKERTLAEYLREYSQGHLARTLGLTQAAISRWQSSGRQITIVEENGKTKAFELKLLGQSK